MLGISQKFLLLALVASTNLALASAAVAEEVASEVASAEEETKDEISCDICKAEMRRAFVAILGLKKALREAEVREKLAKQTLHEHISGTKIVFDEHTGIYNSTTCEGKIAQITCPIGKAIAIQTADYGRKNKETCPSSSIFTTTCTTEKALKHVAKNCENTQKCSVSATNTVFGDPCVYTYKYLTINFKCVEAAATSSPIVPTESNTVTRE